MRRNGWPTWAGIRMDVVAAQHVLPRAGDQGDVTDSGGLGELRVGRAAVADEHRVLGDDGRQICLERAAFEIGQDVVRGGAVAVTDDENGIVLVGRQPRLFRLPAVSSG